jgi:hypothetical protein
MLVARTTLTCPFGDKEVWVRCHIENSAVYRGSGTDKQNVKGLKVGYTYHTGPGDKAQKLEKDDVDFETLWDGLGETGGQERAYTMWAVYFGMPRRSEAYNGIVFESALKAKFPVNPRAIPRPVTASGDITATLDQNLHQVGSASASNTDQVPFRASPYNDIDALQEHVGDRAAMAVWMFGNRDLTEEELSAAASKLQSIRKLKLPPPKSMLIEMAHRKLVEGQYGEEILNHEPYRQWERTHRISEHVEHPSDAAVRAFRTQRNKLQALMDLWKNA